VLILTGLERLHALSTRERTYMHLFLAKGREREYRAQLPGGSLTDLRDPCQFTQSLNYLMQHHMTCPCTRMLLLEHSPNSARDQTNKVDACAARSQLLYCSCQLHRGLNANTTTVSKADKYNCANQTRRREHDQLGRPPVPCFWKTQTLSPAMRADASACYQ